MAFAPNEFELHPQQAEDAPVVPWTGWRLLLAWLVVVLFAAAILAGLVYGTLSIAGVL